MAEYNFWDDRTTEDNDEHYCPIIDGHCYDMSRCDECEDNARFVQQFQNPGEEGMQVKLLNYTPHPEDTVAAAARLCYSKEDIGDLWKNCGERENSRYIQMLSEMGHESPFEHVTFTFGISGISRACSHQLVRHRIASYSQKSQRYVDECQFEYVTPPAIRGNDVLESIYQDTMCMIESRYDIIRQALSSRYVESGMTQKDAEKKANEDARMVLPNACTTSIIVTMNVRSLWNFFKHRCCNRAQWEIRDLANQMLDICQTVAPNLFKYAGPTCAVTGKCPEGKMSCGHPIKKEVI